MTFLPAPTRIMLPVRHLTSDVLPMLVQVDPVSPPQVQYVLVLTIIDEAGNIWQKIGSSQWCPVDLTTIPL